MATDTTRTDNRLLISVWIMFAIGLGIYFRVWDVVNEATGGMFYQTQADIAEARRDAEEWSRRYDARLQAEVNQILATPSASQKRLQPHSPPPMLP